MSPKWHPHAYTSDKISNLMKNFQQKSKEYEMLYDNFQLVNKALIACMMFLEEETKKGNIEAKELLDEITKLGT